MQARHFGGALARELATQKIGKQAVIAPGGQIAIHWREKQLLRVKLFQQVGAVILRIEGGAHRGVEPPQQAGAQEKAPQQRGLIGQHIFGQVIGHGAVGARKARNEIDGVRGPQQRAMRERERGNPALSFGVQRDQVRGIQPLRVAHLFKQGGGFGHAKAQLFGIDLGELAAHAQSAQAYGGHLACANQQVGVGGQVLGQFADQGEHGRLGEHFHLVQKQGKRLGQLEQGANGIA